MLGVLIMVMKEGRKKQKQTGRRSEPVAPAKSTYLSFSLSLSMCIYIYIFANTDLCCNTHTQRVVDFRNGGEITGFREGQPPSETSLLSLDLSLIHSGLRTLVDDPRAFIGLWVYFCSLFNLVFTR